MSWSISILSGNAPAAGRWIMAIRAVVFDAYGTLYDVQSVAGVVEAAFPGHGEYITQVWRLKQLEYTWLRTLMDRYEDFLAITRDSLRYTLGTLGLAVDEAQFDRIVEAYDRLLPYPEAAGVLGVLKPKYRLAILSNGSPAMLDALVRNSGLDQYLAAVISVDAGKAFKPIHGRMGWSRRIFAASRRRWRSCPPTSSMSPGQGASGSRWCGSSG